MEKQKELKTELANLKSFDEISYFIEQTPLLSEEDLIYLNQNLRQIIKNNRGFTNDKSIVRCFLNIQKVLPNSHHLIDLLLQLDDEKIARNLMRIKKKEIIPILDYTYISPIAEEDYEIDWNNSMFYPNFFLSDSTMDGPLNPFVLYTDYNRKSVVLAFIEEFLPYLYQPNFSLELNLVYLLGDEDSIIQYMESHIYQEKIPFSFLAQVVGNYSKLLLSSIIKNIEKIEFYMTGEETIRSIQKAFSDEHSIPSKELLEEKVLNAIIPTKEFRNPKDINTMGTVRFIENILYIQDEHIKGNPYVESELYQKCLDTLYHRYYKSESLVQLKKEKDHYKSESPVQLQLKIEKYLRDTIIEEGSKEPNLLKRKQNLLNTFSKLLEVMSEKELLTFFKIGIPIHASNFYTMEELNSYDAKDFFKLSELMEEEEKPLYFNQEEVILKSLIILGAKLSISILELLNIANHSVILRTVSNASDEKKPFLRELLIELLKVIEKDQNKEIYKGTDLEKKAFHFYQEWMKKNLNIESIDSNILSFSFHKLIQTKDVDTYLFGINDIKKLVLIYKTLDIKINIDDFTLEQIQEMNPKQYKDIINQITLLYEKANNSRIELNGVRIDMEPVTDINTMSLKLNTIFGYELTKRLLKDQNITFSKLESFLSEIQDPLHQIEGFQECLRKHPNIFHLEPSLLKNYYYWYIDLSNNLNKKITYEDIIKYESGAKANLFEDPKYFPISKHILLIQSKDWRRNAYKTSVLWEKQLKRIESTIPELEGDIGNYHYKMVDLHDPDLIFLPNMINCCMEIGGKAEADLVHAVTNKNGRIFAIYQNQEVKAISWVWRNGQVLCFDNVEVKRNEETDELGKIIKEILMQASQELIDISKQKEPPKEAIKLITLGRNPRDIPMKLDEKTLLSNYQEEMYHPEEKEGLYLIDSSKVQYILAGNYDPNTGEKVTTAYLYPRKKAIKFEELDIQYLDSMIKSIRNQKEKFGETPIYQLGYLGEDFYVGASSSGKIDTVYLDNDRRVIYDVIPILEKVQEESKKQQELKAQQKEMMKQIINAPYIISSKQYNNLLEEIKKAPPYPIDPGFYYHQSILECIIDMLRKGSINCKYRLRQRGGGSNGDYYVCVAKKLKVENSSFESYIRNKTSIILKKELPILDRSSQQFNFLNPFFEEGQRRSYNYEDEFQVRDRIEFPYFEGIYTPTKTEYDLINIRKIIDALETFHRDLPIISNTSNTEVDKELIKKYVKPQTKGD